MQKFFFEKMIFFSKNKIKYDKVCLFSFNFGTKQENFFYLHFRTEGICNQINHTK